MSTSIDVTTRIKISASGLPVLKPAPGRRLRAKKHDSTFTITGNKEGLLLLAHALMGLAMMPERPENRGYHVHLDDLYEINDEGIDFILACDEEQASSP